MDSTGLNRAILSELTKIADEVFSKTTIKAGTYTAAELQKEKDANGNMINYVIAKELDHKSYEVCVDGFKCSFLACQVFNLVWKFEQLAGVKSDEKKRFVKMSEVKRDTVCSFYVHIEKSHTSLCRLVAVDQLRPQLTQIFLDAKNGCLVASDGYMMKQMQIQIDSENEIPNGLNLYINPKQIKNMIGKNRVDVYWNDGFNETVITNLETGTYYRNSTAGRFTNYKNVYPMLRRDGHIQFSKKEIKPLIQFCKCASKEAYKAIMSMYIEKGSSKVVFSYVNSQDNSIKECSFCLNEAANITARIGISGEYLVNMAKDWDGGMWIVDPSRAVILDYKNDATGLIMPKMIDNSICPEPGECNIKALERNRATEATHPEPIEAAQVASRAYDVAEKSPMEAAEWPWQLRILLSILYNFDLIKSPLRYAVSLQLEAYMKAILPTAVPTETLLQAIRPAFGTRFGSPIPTLCGFVGNKTHKNGCKNFEKTGTNSLRGGGSMIPASRRGVSMIGGRGAVAMTGCRGAVAMAGCRGGVAMIGGRGGVAIAGGCGGVAMTGGRGGVAASMRRAAAAMNHAPGVSLLIPYALWDLSPFTRPTGASPPSKGKAHCHHSKGRRRSRFRANRRFDRTPVEANTVETH